MNDLFLFAHTPEQLFSYYASHISQHKCKCDDRFIVWRYVTLWTTTIATRNTYICHNQNFLASPKNKEVSCICHIFLGGPEQRETVDTFWVGQHCLDNTEGGISQRMENGYFLLVQTPGILPSLSASYTLSSQEHTKYYIKRQTWGYAYVKSLVWVIFPAQNTDAFKVLVLVEYRNRLEK